MCSMIWWASVYCCLSSFMSAVAASGPIQNIFPGSADAMTRWQDIGTTLTSLPKSFFISGLWVDIVIIRERYTPSVCGAEEDLKFRHYQSRNWWAGKVCSLRRKCRLIRSEEHTSELQ